MKIILFTKFLQGLGVRETGEAVRRLGFDGLDVAVRDGYCVNPENAQQTLPEAVKAWRGDGLIVPLVSTRTDWTDPQHAGTRALFRACGEAGISFIKIGYWLWKPGEHYWDQIARHREALKAFERMGRDMNVCTLVHTHSDCFYGCNASAAMHLVAGFDPRHVGVYLDPAHLALDGEPLPMALDIVRDYLKMVGVKNSMYRRNQKTGAWERVFPPLAEGLVDWREAIRLLKAAGYQGPLSYHGEVDGATTARELELLVTQELPLLRSFLQ